MVAEYRFKVLLAMLRELAELRLLSQGLIRLSAESASKVLAEGVSGSATIKGCLEEFLGRLDLEGTVELRGDEALVEVRACPLCLDPLGELCPLPFLLASALARVASVRAYPVRIDEGLFVSKCTGGCRIKLRVRGPVKKDSDAVEG